MKFRIVCSNFHGIIFVMQIIRQIELTFIKQRFKNMPIIGILGPRQCGKTTLAKQYCDHISNKNIHFFDLENPNDFSALSNPMAALEDLTGTVIIDEIQRMPEIFPILRVLADQKKNIKFLILGSASPNLIKNSSESLAGRISYLQIEGFSTNHIQPSQLEKLWVYGGFPRSFLAKSVKESFLWRQDFITTFLERDIPNLGINIPAQMLRRFWMMIAHYHGQTFNASEIGKSLGISDHTAKKYLDILTQTFLIRQLTPWINNTKKRLVKTPKIFFRDSGLLHAILQIKDKQSILRHPKLGASWEGFALEQFILKNRLKDEEVFFWSIHSSAEIDLIYLENGQMNGVEVKYTDSPKITKSILVAIDQLALNSVTILYPGKKTFKLNSKITARPLI